MKKNIIKSALQPWKAGKYIARIIPDLVSQNPEIVLRACQAAGIKSFQTSYLGKYEVSIDAYAGVIALDVIRTGNFQFPLFETAMSRLDREVRTFVNVGANMGTTCLNAHFLGFREFVAFEPVDRNFQLLTRNLRENLQGSKADCRKLALGNEIGTAIIQLNGENCGRHSLKDGFNVDRSITSEQEVEVSTLDHQDIDSDCVIWIDTEGFELEVIQGSKETLRSRCAALCVEVSPAVYSAGELTDLESILCETFSKFFDADGVELKAPSESRHWQTGQQHDLICIK